MQNSWAKSFPNTHQYTSKNIFKNIQKIEEHSFKTVETNLKGMQLDSATVVVLATTTGKISTNNHRKQYGPVTSVFQASLWGQHNAHRNNRKNW